MPGSLRRPSSVSGNTPPWSRSTATRAGMEVARARIVAEPGLHPQHVVLRRRRASAALSGQRARNFSKYGPTVFTPVCCSMISDSQTRYGSAPLPGRRPPRQAPAMAVVPIEQQRKQGDRRCFQPIQFVVWFWRLQKASSVHSSVGTQSLRVGALRLVPGIHVFLLRGSPGTNGRA